MTIVYHEDDGDLSELNGKTIGLIGYGNLGRPFALNLRDSGVNVMVGRRDETGGTDAVVDGFIVTNIPDVVLRCEVVVMMLPDEVMASVYLEQVSPHLVRGQSLIFGSAYNVAFGFIEAPPFVDVGLIAPRTLGALVRERYESGQGFHSFVAVGQDASGRAWRTVLALAKGVGSLRAGAVEVSFEQEAELDLFTQQAVLPAFHNLLMTAAHLLIKMGYPPEAVLTELYLSEEFANTMQKSAQLGFMEVVKLASLTSQYGTLSRFERFNEQKLERLMEITLDEIRNGRFAKEWAKEYSDGHPRLNNLLKNRSTMELWELEQQVLEALNNE